MKKKVSPLEELSEFEKVESSVDNLLLIAQPYMDTLMKRGTYPFSGRQSMHGREIVEAKTSELDDNEEKERERFMMFQVEKEVTENEEVRSDYRLFTPAPTKKKILVRSRKARRICSQA